MDKLILELTNNRFYWPSVKTNDTILHLAFWLTDDVGCHAIRFYKGWLNNPEDSEGGGNYSHLEKNDGNVRIWFEVDWFEETPGAEYLEIPIAALNYILDRWQEACEKKPKKIIITIDQGKATVEFED